MARWTVTPPIQARVRLWRTAAPGSSFLDSARVIFFCFRKPIKMEGLLVVDSLLQRQGVPLRLSRPLASFRGVTEDGPLFLVLKSNLAPPFTTNHIIPYSDSFFQRVWEDLFLLDVFIEHGAGWWFIVM